VHILRFWTGSSNDMKYGARASNHENVIFVFGSVFCNVPRKKNRRRSANMTIIEDHLKKSFRDIHIIRNNQPAGGGG
jgi:hypothetical protein